MVGPMVALSKSDILCPFVVLVMDHHTVLPPGCDMLLICYPRGKLQTLLLHKDLSSMSVNGVAPLLVPLLSCILPLQRRIVASIRSDSFQNPVTILSTGATRWLPRSQSHRWLPSLAPSCPVNSLRRIEASQRPNYRPSYCCRPSDSRDHSGSYKRMVCLFPPRAPTISLRM